MAYQRWPLTGKWLAAEKPESAKARRG